MINKVRVYGKAQNRTALGIIHAYMVIYPQATLEDLRKAFPDSLNPDSGVKINFIYPEDNKLENFKGYFLEENELITDGDGRKVAVATMWTKPSFERIVEHAKQYGIEVAKFEEAEKGIGKKGGFRLEYLNGWTPAPKEPEKPKSKWWLWLIIAAIIILLILLLLKACEKPKVVEKVVEVEKVITRVDTVTVVDTVYVEQIKKIQENFNAAQFQRDKWDLSEDAKFVLHDLQKLMEENPELKLKIVGHTSSEGDPTHNQKLSEKRAKAAVDFLVSKGVAEDRLQYEGKGSSEPIDENNLEVNRRTEFIVIK